MPPARTGESLIRHLMRSTVSNYIGRFVHLGTWFLLTPFILHRLGSDLYGLWVLVGSVVGYSSILDFGISSAVTKYVAEFRARDDWDEARQLVGTALLLYSGLGMAVIVLSVLVAPFFTDLFNVPPADRSTAFWLVVLMGVHFGLSIPCGTPSSVLQGFQRFDLINLLGVSSTLARAGAIVAVLLAGAGPIGIVIVDITVMVLVQIPSIWLIRRTEPDFGFRLRGASRAMARRITSFSSSSFMLHVGGRLETQTDEIVIGATLPVGIVAPYNLARMLSSLPQMLAEQFLTLLLPLASEMDAVKDRARLRSLFIVGTRVTLGLLLPISLGLMFLGGAILNVWVGEAYAGYGYLVVILTLAALIDTCVWPGGLILQGIARHRLTAVSSLVTGFSNLGLSIILVGSMGLTGVALGTLIPTTVIGLGFVLPYCAHVIGVSARAVFVQILLPALVPAAPAALVLGLIRETLHPASVVAIVLTAGTGAAVYVVLYLRSSACAFERRQIHDLREKGWRSTLQWLARSEDE